MIAERVPFLVFLHIQKTGGMTLQRTLRRCYGPSLWRCAWDQLTASRAPKAQGFAGFHDWLESRRPRDRFVAGHFCFGAHTRLPQPVKYLTLLREPISRLVSLYHYSKFVDHAYYHAHARDASPEQFLLRSRLLELDNGQLRFLVGGGEDGFINRTPWGKCDRAMLDQAKENLDKWFLAAGTTERFDEFVLLLASALGWRSAAYLRQNEGSRQWRKEVVSEAILDALRERNALDIELHQHVDQQMDRLIREEGRTFADRLERLRARNRLLQRTLGGVYQYWRSGKDAIKPAIHGLISPRTKAAESAAGDKE